MARPQYDFSVAQHRPQAIIKLYSGNTVYTLETDLIAIARSKQIGQASGQWTIQLVDRVGSDGLTWQQRAQTGDYIEIYEANQPTAPQMVMRGFIINPQRNFDIGQTGGPTRYTQLAGLDMGYIVQANQVRYLWPIDPTAVVGNQYQLSSVYGIKPGAVTPSQFFSDTMDKLVNGVGVANMQEARQSGIPPKFATACDLPSQYQINTISVQAYTGQYWNLLSYFSSAPFSELFYVDLPSSPTMYYRQPPYRALDGSYLGVFGKPTALLPTVAVKLVDKKSHALGRSCNEMYAFFMTYSDLAMINQNLGYNYAAFFGGAAQNDITQDSIVGSVGTHNPSNPIYDKSIENRYGFQQLSISTPFISALTQGFFSDVAVPMNTWMYNVFKHNDQFESGTITVHGDPNITIGRYVHVPEWGMDFYVTGITDNFVQYQTWTMDLQVIRGYAYGTITNAQIYSSSGAKTTQPRMQPTQTQKPTPPAPPPNPPGSPTGPKIQDAGSGALPSNSPLAPPPPPNTHPAYPGGPPILGH